MSFNSNNSSYLGMSNSISYSSSNEQEVESKMVTAAATRAVTRATMYVTRQATKVVSQQHTVVSPGLSQQLGLVVQTVGVNVSQRKANTSINYTKMKISELG